MRHLKRFFLFSTAYHKHHTSPSAKEEYAMTVLLTMYHDPEVSEKIKARLWSLIAPHAEKRNDSR